MTLPESSYSDKPLSREAGEYIRAAMIEVLPRDHPAHNPILTYQEDWFDGLGLVETGAILVALRAMPPRSGR